MKFIVEIPDERMSPEVKKCIWDRMKGGVAGGTIINEVKEFKDFDDLQLANIFIGNPFCEIINITKLELLKMTKHKCEKCKYYDKVSSVKGLCRRYPPTERSEIIPNHLYPVVLLDDWCGEYNEEDLG